MEAMSSQTPDLNARYRGPSTGMRVVALVLIVGLALSGLGFVGWAFLFTSTPEVQSRLTQFTFNGENQAVARLTVVRETETTQATCLLTALAEDHTVVGERQILVNSGPTEQVVTVTIETERRATAIESRGCTTPAQSRPR